MSLTLRILVLLVAVAARALTLDEITADLECDALASVADAAASMNTVAVTTFNTTMLPLQDQFDDAELRATYGLSIDPLTFQLTATNSANQSIGQVYSWADLTSLEMVATPLTQLLACTGTPGCDGFILKTNKVVGSFPRTAIQYQFTFREIYSQLNLTQGGRRRLLSASADMQPFATSEPRVFIFKVTQDIHDQVFLASEASTMTAVIAGTTVGCIALCLLLAAIVSYIRSAPTATPRLYRTFDSDTDEPITEMTHLHKRAVPSEHAGSVRIVPSHHVGSIRIV